MAPKTPAPVQAEAVLGLAPTHSSANARPIRIFCTSDVPS